MPTPYYNYNTISDCADSESARWQAHFMVSFRNWIEALRGHLAA
jgi:hypothetical protein